MPTFPNSALNDPSRAQCRVVEAPDWFLQPTATQRDYRSNFGDASKEKRIVEQRKISGSGAPQTPLKGKSAHGVITENLGDLDPNCYGILHYFANFTGLYDVVDNTPVFNWEFSPSAGTTAAQYLTRFVDEDRGVIERWMGLRVSAIEISAEPNGNLQVNIEYGINRYDWFGDITQTAGSGSTLPTIHGVYGARNAEGSTIDDIIFQYVSGTDWKSRLEAAGTFGSTQFTVTPGNEPTTIDDSNDDDDSYAGFNFGNPGLIAVPASPTLTAADEFTITPRRARWSSSPLALHSIPVVNSRLWVNDVLFKITGGWTLRFEWTTFEVADDASFEQGAIITRSGFPNVTLTLDRKFFDLTIQTALEDRNTVPIALDCATDEVISAENPYRFQAILPEARPSGDTATIGEGGENTDESATLIAGDPAASYAFGGHTVSDHYAVFIQNGAAGL